MKNGKQFMTDSYRLVLRNIVITVLVLTISACSTQPVLRSFSDLDQRLQPGSIVYITNHDNVKARALVKQVTDNELLLDVKGSSQTMTENEIRKIDRFSNPVFHGFLTGLGVGVLNAVFSDPQYESCQDDSQRQCAIEDSGDRLLTTGILSVAGIAAGMLIARRDPLYLAPANAAHSIQPSIAIVPYTSGNKPMPGLSIWLQF